MFYDLAQSRFVVKELFSGERCNNVYARQNTYLIISCTSFLIFNAHSLGPVETFPSSVISKCIISSRPNEKKDLAFSRLFLMNTSVPCLEHSKLTTIPPFSLAISPILIASARDMLLTGTKMVAA